MNPHIKLVIGLVGKKNSGKDTVQTFLKEAIFTSMRIQVYRQAFADELKAEVASLFGAHNPIVLELNKHIPVVRRALQDWGEHVRQTQDINYWIKKSAILLPLYECPCVVIFTDVRHKNEADFISKECSGILVRIRRYKSDNSDDTHISETALESIQCDHIINNDWTLDRLHFMCKDLVAVLKDNGSLGL